MRTIELKQIGYRVKGEVELNLWGGGKSFIVMQPTDIEELTTENIIRSINDNGFGCESYAGAEVDIYVLYERGVEEYLTSASFTQEDLWGCTNTNTDFKKLAEDYEKNVRVIADNEELLINQ